MREFMCIVDPPHGLYAQVPRHLHGPSFDASYPAPSRKLGAGKVITNRFARPPCSSLQLRSHRLDVQGARCCRGAVRCLGGLPQSSPIPRPPCAVAAVL